LQGTKFKANAKGRNLNQAHLPKKNPKAEIRDPKEIRKLSATDSGFGLSDLGVRISGLLLLVPSLPVFGRKMPPSAVFALRKSSL
jgi:hypothetical protein